MRASKYTNLTVIIFFLVAALDIIGIIFDEKIMRYIFKPLIIPILVVLYTTLTSKINYKYLVALFFCFLGDVFLVFDGSSYFMLGLGSFLLGHIVFISIVLEKMEAIHSKFLLTSAIPFAMVFIALIYLTYSNLEAMLVPVVVYGLVINIFGTLTFYFYRKTKTIKAFLLVLGASIFILSDASIAIDMFYISKPYIAPFIMVTYVIAQYLICYAFVEAKTT